MFDNLKKKLGSFREDAEEAAEENVEEVDPEEDDVELEETAPEPEAEPERELEDSPEGDVGPEETEAVAEAEAASDPGPGSGPDAASPPEAGVGDRLEESDAEPAALEGEDEDDEAAADDEEPDEPQEESNSTGFGRKAKSLVKGKFVIEEEDLEDPLYELEMALLSSDVEMNVAQEILDNIRDELVGETRTFTTSTGEVVEDALREAIYDVISVGQFDFDERIAIEDKPVTIVFTGVNGVGKTTTIAKMSRYFEERGYSTVMANGDTYRAGANEQIQEHADALDTKCISHEQGGDPAAVLYDAVEYAEANDVDVVLGDTAGRLHTDEGLMDQLEKIDRVVDPDMTLFVDEAVAGQDAVNRAREFNEAAEIDGAILTKADADSNGGAAISIAHVTGKPILFLGVGQGYDHLERFDPDEMVDRLLEDDE
ncbi:signal recognition particle-docking protein FtsY [Halobiforma haloterrestris]|uniref:Signal recognition particle receptor FtsY n=1 Tax=Natronobacterium haloterrestre TaxID=148448 RepID=A0A1I1H494_NATHA|nr:signal recognition particle-docking protein FtsY [Halobiforma haloterrestris]SFC18837.1 signal recognition particle-docking protein FtsY [Halobiforma haloterrestris]